MTFEHHDRMSDAFAEALDYQRMEHDDAYREVLEEPSKDGTELWDLVSDAAQAMTDSAEGLADGSRSASELLEAAAERMPEGPLEHKHFGLLALLYAWFALGEKSIKMLRTAEKRFVKLAMLSRKLNPMPPARRFLRRVSACYQYGFDSECVIMCGAVLESTLKSQVPPDDGTRRYERIDMIRRIEIAVESAQLTPELATAAHRIRKARNRAVHEDPDFTGDVLAVVEDTMRIIDALERR